MYITDRNSRHGTYLNHLRLESNIATQIHDGDVLKFGIDIQREDTSYPPPSAMVGINMNSSAEPEASHIKPQSARFYVPDDSDSDVSSDDGHEDDDCDGIRRTMQTLRSLAGKPHPRMSSEPGAEKSQAEPSTISKLAGAVLVDLSDEVTPAPPTVVDLTRDSPPPGDSRHDQHDGTKSSVADYSGRSDAATIASVPDVRKSHFEERMTLDQADLDASLDFHEISDDESDKSDNDDQTSCVYDADDNVPVSGHIAWEADSLPSSPVPVCSGALQVDPASTHDSDDDIDFESVSSEAELEDDSDDSQSMDHDDLDEESVDEVLGAHREDRPTCLHEEFSEDEEEHDEEACHNYLFDDVPPYASLRPAPIPNGDHIADYRLPPISNMLPSQAPLFQAQDQPRFDYHTTGHNTQDPSGTGTYWQNYSSFGQNSAPHAINWAVNNNVYSDTSIVPPKEQGVVGDQPLPSQSPLITSGEKFLFSPPQQDYTILQQRESPELDMGSAYQFHHSKIHSAASKTKSEDHVAVQPTITNPNTGSDVKRAITVDQLLSEPHDIQERRLTFAKRKADEISDLADSEKEAEQARINALAAPATPEGSKEEPKTLKGPVQPAPERPAVDSTVHVPKRMRSMAEAARFVALGGVTAGAAVFAALVATAPSFT